MPAKTIEQPETDKLSNQSLTIIEQAKSIVVKDAETYQKAADVISVGKSLLKQIGETFDPLIESAHKAHKQLLATKKQFTDPIEVALSVKRREMSAYELEQTRLRKLEEARLAEIARKDQEAKAIEEASVLEEWGEVEEAEEVLQKAIEAPAPTVRLPEFKASDFGAKSRSVWKWKIVDLGKLPIHFLSVVRNPSTGLEQDISTAAVGALVRSLKSKELCDAQFKGSVEVWEERTTY